MLIAHKIIDALERRGNYTMRSHAGNDHLLAMVRHVREAEKFQFTRLPLELHPAKPLAQKDDPLGLHEGPGEAYHIPNLTHDEQEFWSEGLIPLPAPKCLYEFQLGEARSALVCMEDQQGDVAISRIDLFANNDCFADCIWMVHNRKNLTKEFERNAMAITFTGPADHVEIIKQQTPTWQARMYGANFMLGVYMTLMLNSRSTEISTEQPPAKLNKAREKRGNCPLFTHRVVNLTPERFTRGHNEGQGGTHASPRLHWRRSHVRMLPNGKRTVVVRHLVGKTELGEVSHEYQVT
jgi:hypothetical protein